MEGGGRKRHDPHNMGVLERKTHGFGRGWRQRKKEMLPSVPPLWSKAGKRSQTPQAEQPQQRDIFPEVGKHWILGKLELN